MSEDAQSKNKAAAGDLGLLEDDDEFEEFPHENWDESQEDKADINVWEDNWDDDTVEDDFSVQLSKHSRKRAIPHSPPVRSPSPASKKVRRGRSPSQPSPKTTPNGRSRSSRSSSKNNSTGPVTPTNTTPPPPATQANVTPPATRSSARLRSSRKS